jgi:hypothetical protein
LEDAIKEFFDHMISVLTWWHLLEILWLAGLGWYGHRLWKRDGWFKDPFVTTAMFWEIPLFGAVSAFLTTDFQLESLFFIMKWHYFREWARQDKFFGGALAVFVVSGILLILVLSPVIGV